jgi:hypothetical protein
MTRYDGFTNQAAILMGIPVDDDQRSDLMPMSGSRVMAIRIPG